MRNLFLLLLLYASLHANHAVVFMYHHFGVGKHPSTNVTLEQFQNHLDYLQVNNYNVWPLSKILYNIKHKHAIPPKTVALTIDDAYISVYTHAYPMLKEKGFAFSVFVNTMAIGSKNFMSWEQMREMQLHGGEFANHSLTHKYLVPKEGQTKQQCQEMITNEVQGAQTMLQENLGSTTNENPRLFSYPFGEYTKESAAYIQSLGYIGIGQVSGVLDSTSDLKKVPRFAMAEQYADMDSFILKLNTLALPVKSTKPWGTKLTSNPPSLEIELERKVPNIACYTSDGSPIEIEWISDTILKVQAKKPLEGIRERYTCTALSDTGKWYWYSHLWIIQKH